VKNVFGYLLVSLDLSRQVTAGYNCFQLLVEQDTGCYKDGLNLAK